MTGRREITLTDITDRLSGLSSAAIRYVIDTANGVLCYRANPEEARGMTEHDDHCEAEYVVGAAGYTDCGCSSRENPTTEKKPMKVRTNEPHGIPFEEATTRLYKVSDVPYVDFAAQALIEAQNRYFAAHPEQRRIANALLWEIEPADEVATNAKTAPLILRSEVSQYEKAMRERGEWIDEDQEDDA